MDKLTDNLNSFTETANNWRPSVLVLGPGGVKGFLELGALLILEKEKYLDNIKTYVGVSIGSILSFLIVTGYTITEIIKEAMDFDLFQDISILSLGDIKKAFVQAKKNAGLLPHNKIKEKLSQLMIEKFNRVLTLKELYMATGLELVTITTNLDKDIAEYLSWKTYPNLSAVEAVLMSMNIPLLFYQIIYGEDNDVYIDGAFSNPYPIDQYDDKKTDILGIYIATPKKTEKPIGTDICYYLYKIISSGMVQLRKRNKKMASARCKHLKLTTAIIDTVGIAVTFDAKCQMIYNGYFTAKRFFEELKQIHHTIVIHGAELNKIMEKMTEDDCKDGKEDNGQAVEKEKLDEKIPDITITCPKTIERATELADISSIMELLQDIRLNKENINDDKES